MINLELQTTDGEKLILPIPQSAAEISLDDYHEFEFARRKYLASDETETVVTKAACLEAIYGEAVYSLQAYSENEGFNVGQDITLGALYHHIEMLCQYQPNQAAFESKAEVAFNLGGKTFHLHGNSAPLLLGALMNKKVTTGEVAEFEALEKEHNEYLTLLDKGKAKNDNVKDLCYTLRLKQIAILCREKGEKLPFAPSELEAFINKRIQFFHDHKLSLGVAKDMAFFLQIKQMKFVQHLQTIQSSQVSKKAMKAMVAAEKRAKRIAGKKESSKRGLRIVKNTRG